MGETETHIGDTQVSLVSREKKSEPKKGHLSEEAQVQNPGIGGGNQLLRRKKVVNRSLPKKRSLK